MTKRKPHPQPLVRLADGTALSAERLQAGLDVASPMLEPLVECTPDLRHDIENAVPTQAPPKAAQVMVFTA